MSALIVGSTGASCRSRGIAAVDVLHAVRVSDCRTLCGAPVIFLFLDTAFPAGDAEAELCSSCRALARSETSAAA